MTKTNFKSKTFFWTLIIILVGILIWNLLTTISYSNLLGILPITIQCILLTLIFMKHKYAKIGIKIWTILFLITASGLQFVGRFLKDMGTEFNNVDFQHYLKTGITVLIGVILLIYANKTIEIKEIE